MSKELINLSNLQRFLSKLSEKFALKKAMKGISEDAEGNIIIGEEGLVPTPDENSKGKFLRSDGEWALPSETAVYDSMTLEEGVAGVSKVDKVLSAKNLKQIVNSDGFLTSLDSSKLTGVINIENLPQGALERILIVSSKEERLTLLDTEVQLGDVVKESDTGLMYYVINTEKLNSEEGYTQFTAGQASSVPWSGVTDKPTIPTKTSDLTNDSDFAIDSGVVHKTGDETINGTKTFTVGPVASNSATTNGYFVKLNAVARNEVPSQLYHATFRANDKNDKILGEWCIEKSTTGCTQAQINVRSEDENGKQLSQSLYLNMSNDGNDVRFYPNSNNKMDLGMSNHKWAKVYSDDIVHTSGDEYINGTKIFYDTIYRQADISTSTVETVYILEDTNAKPCGSIYNRMHWYNNNVYNRHQSYNATSGKDMFLEILSDNDGSGVVNTGGSVTNNKNLTTVTNATGNSYVATMGWVNNPATSTNVVHRSGDETIAGNKTFSNKIKGNLQGNADTATSADNGVDSYGSRWIRFKNGIQMCWGGGEYEEMVSFHKAFISNPSVNCTPTSDVQYSLVVNLNYTTNTQFSCRLWNIQTNDWQYNSYFHWVAIGLWK